MMDDFELLSGELAGFDLSGWRQVNGVIELRGTKKRFIAAWPDIIYLLGNTYTLEDVIKGNVNQDTGAIFESAQYA